MPQHSAPGAASPQLSDSQCRSFTNPICDLKQPLKAGILQLAFLIEAIVGVRSLGKNVAFVATIDDFVMKGPRWINLNIFKVIYFSGF